MTTHQMNMTCENCRFFFNQGSQCRRYPPTVFSCGEYNEDSCAFPGMRKDEWCGEFKIKG